MTDSEYKTKIDKLLDLAITKDASDIHLSVGRPPVLRIDGKLILLNEFPVLSKEDTDGLSSVLLSEKDKEKFVRSLDVDFSFNFDEKARFRASVYRQLGAISIAMRLLPRKIKNIDELHLPPVCRELAKASQGFFLSVGPAGQGKSTALAAILDEINHTRQDHIVTIEDPIEYLFTQDKCIVDQREVGKDVKSFRRGLRGVFRQDPDVIMIGEMRDPETISNAVTAAETGHLVLSTLHTNTVSQTIDRIIDAFPPHQQNQIRMQLAATILGILSRRLVPMIGGGVINAVELMIANSAVRNLIREGKTHQIDMVIETGTNEGMISLNRSLAELVGGKLISVEDAERQSLNVNDLRMMIKRIK